VLDLLQIRDEIDKIDRSIVELFEQRMSLVNNVAEYKLATGKPVLDREREQIKIEKAKELAHGDFNKQGISELFVQMMAISRKWQYRLLQEYEEQHGGNVQAVKSATEAKDDYRVVDAFDFTGATVAYCGIPGAYAHQALRGYFGSDVKEISVASFRQAMEAIREQTADYAVLPIENTSAGIVNDVYDLMVEFDNRIIDTYDLPISHSLLVVKGAKMEDIRFVYSHPQALMQCQKYLDGHLEWSKIRTENTAISAKLLAEDGDRTHAAIASSVNAELYGLDILEENLQHNDNNMTRFVVIGRKAEYRKDAQRISISFELPHEEGALYNMLSHFIYNDLSMTKIESRPIQGKNWQYRFYVEFEGRLDQAGVKNALRGIEAEAIDMRLLGNY